jgi:aryl-alcohol dehydrogenase
VSTLVIVGAPPFGSEVPLDVNSMLAGRTVTGLTLGDSETQTLIPVLVSLVGQGRLPVGRLITEYAFQDIDQAAQDMASAKAIKPVLRL